jgi:hypothetical protein
VEETWLGLRPRQHAHGAAPPTRGVTSQVTMLAPGRAGGRRGAGVGLCDGEIAWPARQRVRTRSGALIAAKPMIRPTAVRRIIPLRSRFTPSIRGMGIKTATLLWRARCPVLSGANIRSQTFVARTPVVRSVRGEGPATIPLSDARAPAAALANATTATGRLSAICA